MCRGCELRAARSAARRWDRASLGPSSLSLSSPSSPPSTPLLLSPSEHPPRLRGSFTAGRQVRSGVCPYLGRSPLDKDASHSKRSSVFRGIWHNARLPPLLYLGLAFVYVDVDSGDGVVVVVVVVATAMRGPKTIRFHSTVIGSRSRSPGVRGSALLKAERVLCNELPPTTASHHRLPAVFASPPPPALFVPAERFETARTPPLSAPRIPRESSPRSRSRERERERDLFSRLFASRGRNIYFFFFLLGRVRKKRLSDFSFYFKFKILRGGNFLEFLRVFDKGKWWHGILDG